MAVNMIMSFEKIGRLWLRAEKSERGASLFEMVVAVMLFAVMMLSITAIFQLAIDGQRNAVASKNIQENLRYALEVMSKEARNPGGYIREGAGTPLDCTDAFPNDNNNIYSALRPNNFQPITTTNCTPNNRNGSGEGGKLAFRNKYGHCVVYYLDGNRLKIRRNDGAAVIDEYITPADIEVTGFKVFTRDDCTAGIGSTKQSSATLVITAEYEPAASRHKQAIALETTITARIYEE